jgi:outer membrane protein assembly factor BamB
LTLNQGFFALDLYNGKIAWWSEAMDYPWDAAGFGGYSVQSAYGLLYRQAYSGIYAFNWTNGKIVWKYEAPADYPYETPYINEAGETMYSWNIGANIADGKMYAYNTEHSATVPITRGWKFHCINATTGERIWQVAIPGAASKHTADVGPIHDGYVQLFSSDGYMYWFGKGKSATTVTAPDIAAPLGTAVLIKGTVLDQSPAQPGTPCVSTDSVAAWMEHVHLQRDLPANVTGVTVSLDTVDPNGNYVHIDDVTTDGYSGTFGYTWEPEVPGQYTVTATFMGDASYGSSFAQTYVTVGPAPTVAPTTEPEPAPDYTWTIVGMGIAIIIAVIIATILILRKHP